MVSNQRLKSASVLALVAGKQPLIPALQAAMTISGLVTKNIGAQMTGRDIRAFMALSVLRVAKVSTKPNRTEGVPV